MTLLYILLALVLLGVLITVHEYGHFLAARLTGIAVKEFSIGFGPKLVQWKSKKHETVFSLRPIPMGGYCMFYGDTDDDPNGLMKDDPRNYNNAAVWKRMFSVISGPLMNLLLAFVVAIVLMAGYGVMQTQPFVQSVEDGMPAQEAGMLPGDVFVSIGSVDVREGTVSEISDAINAAGANAPVEVVVLRDGAEKTLSLTPQWNAEEARNRVGIMISGVTRLPASQVIPQAWNSCVYASRVILDALGKLVTTGEGLDQTAGPIGVIQLVAEQTKQGGLEIFLNLMVVISINLGLFNLIPIPGLDGSRLIFMLIEAIRRKPVSQKIESMVHLCGYVLLLGVMVFFTFQDVGRLFGR